MDNSSYQQSNQSVESEQSKKGILSYSVFTATVALSLGLGYGAYRLAAADYAFGQSLLEAAANRGNQTYNLQIKAIQQNPFNTTYRSTYAQTNLALANVIASKEEITAQDRATIQQLISQSIREGKAVIALNPLNARNWANLASIYRSLLNVAASSDQWAIASFQQAISLDPNNPQLRLSYGQLLFSLNQFEASQRQFEIAVTLKQDFANARYNLAISLKQQNKYDRAMTQLEQTLGLVEAGSTDFDTIQQAIQDLKGLIASESDTEKVAGTSTEDEITVSKLSEPEASPEASLDPRIELPEDAAPPKITPISEPTITVAPTNKTTE